MQITLKKSIWTLLFTFVCFTLTGIFSSVLAQEILPKVPTPMEFMASNNRLFYQLVVKKMFFLESRFGFLSVSSLSVSYDNDKNELEMTIPVVFNYQLYKGFAIVGGGTTNNKVGLSPLFGVQHSYSSKEWVAVTIGTLLLNSRKTEFFGIYEFKPHISPKTGCTQEHNFCMSKILSRILMPGVFYNSEQG